jgi:hypothetical protein
VGALARRLGWLLAGALLAGCSRPPPAPHSAEAAAPEPPIAIVPRASAPGTAAPAAAAPPAASAWPALPELAWPKGLALRRSGVLGGAAAPAAWFEFTAEDTTAADAAGRTLAALTEAAGAGALSDLSAARDGTSVIGQVRGPLLSAVVAAASEGRTTTVRVTLEPLR